jgi:outer membrane biogenesis lipoprotein LolB
MRVQSMFKFFVYAIASIVLSACSFGSTSDGQVSTLYRNSVTDENMRIHIATFDASEKEEYNRGNCGQAQLLFQNQPGVKTRFWCEKGRFKK